jgi:hypothetical protein
MIVCGKPRSHTQVTTDVIVRADTFQLLGNISNEIGELLNFNVSC